jgi:transcriptional regulator
MYVPQHFAESDPAALHAFIERYSFGLLVTQVDGVPFASHLPFLLDRAAGPHGTLMGHMARANPQWRHVAGHTALAVFSGPHAYISPSWYETEHVVPTWNYTAVHAYGPVELVEDRDALLVIVERSVATFEAAMPNPWALDATGAFVDRLLGQIVGFRIPIERLEGKWKLSQNHPAERREKVVRALAAQGGEDARRVAEMMRATTSAGG